MMFPHCPKCKGSHMTFMISCLITHRILSHTYTNNGPPSWPNKWATIMVMGLECESAHHPLETTKVWPFPCFHPQCLSMVALIFIMVVQLFVYKLIIQEGNMASYSSGSLMTCLYTWSNSGWFGLSGVQFSTCFLPSLETNVLWKWGEYSFTNWAIVRASWQPLT